MEKQSGSQQDVRTTHSSVSSCRACLVVDAAMVDTLDLPEWTSSEQLQTLAAWIGLPTPPALVHVHAPLNLALVSTFIASTVAAVHDDPSLTLGVTIDAIGITTPNDFYSLVLNHFGQTGSSSVPRSSIAQELPDDSFDSFCVALRSVYALPSIDSSKPRFLVIENPERLFGSAIGESSLTEGFFLASLTRLRELTQKPFCVVLLSSLSWNRLQPPVPRYATPFDLIRIPALSKNDIIHALSKLVTTQLCSTDSSQSQLQKQSQKQPQSYYHPIFLELVYSMFSPIFAGSLSEYTIFVRKLWPRWVDLLQDHKYDASRTAVKFKEILPRERDQIGRWQISWVDLTGSPGHGDEEREINGLDPNIGVESGRQENNPPILELPSLAKWILIAAFYCSYNPPATDIRLFATFDNEGVSTPRKRRRANGGGNSAHNTPSRSGGGGSAKKKTVGRPSKAVALQEEKRTKKKLKESQLVLGPKAFHLERLIAICECLLLSQSQTLEGASDGSDFFIQISNLFALGLIVRASNSAKSAATVDKLISMRLKCNINKYMADRLAREVGVNLDDRLWEDEDVYERL